MGLYHGLSLVRDAKERLISQRWLHTKKWQCMVFHFDGLVLRGSEDYLGSCIQHHHSASEKTLFGICTFQLRTSGKIPTLKVSIEFITV